MSETGTSDAAPAVTADAGPIVIRWSRDWTDMSWRRIGIVIAALFALIPILLIIASFTSSRWGPAIVFGAAGLVVAVYFSYRHLRLEKAISEELERTPDPRRAIEILIPLFENRNVTAAMGEVARGLARRGSLGLTVLVVPESFAVPARPIDVQFEPLPIDEADEAFLQLAAMESDDSGALLGPLEKTEGGYYARRMRRGWRLVGPLVLCLAVSFAMSLWSALRRGDFSWGSVIVLGALLYSLFGVSDRRSWRYLLLPGGMLSRKTRLFDKRHRNHRFVRAESVLIAFQVFKRHWSWVVADSVTRAGGLCTELELKVILRAWMSSATPPSIEQLEGLG